MGILKGEQLPLPLSDGVFVASNRPPIYKEGENLGCKGYTHGQGDESGSVIVRQITPAQIDYKIGDRVIFQSWHIKPHGTVVEIRDGWTIVDLDEGSRQWVSNPAQELAPLNPTKRRSHSKAKPKTSEVMEVVDEVGLKVGDRVIRLSDRTEMEVTRIRDDGLFYCPVWFGEELGTWELLFSRAQVIIPGTYCPLSDAPAVRSLTDFSVGDSVLITYREGVTSEVVMIIAILNGGYVQVRYPTGEQPCIHSKFLTKIREQPDSSSLLPNSGGWEEVKFIRGHYYRYLRYRQDGRMRSRYLGKAIAPTHNAAASDRKSASENSM